MRQIYFPTMVRTLGMYKSISLILLRRVSNINSQLVAILGFMKGRQYINKIYQYHYFKIVFLKLFNQ